MINLLTTRLRAAPRAWLLLASFTLAAVCATACASGDTGAQPTATSAAAATATVDPDLATQLDEIERKVIEIRGLSKPEPVPYHFVTPDEMEAVLEELLSEEEVVEDLELADTFYKLLGLIPQDSNFGDLYRSLLSSQVLGLYDDEKKEFLVLRAGSSEGLGITAETTYAHEYVHRLQDAHFDLHLLGEEAEANSDRELALTSLVEGDAVSTQSMYMLRHIGVGGFGALLSDAATAEARSHGVPYVLRRSLEFPYVEGTEFVSQLSARGGFEEVNEAYSSPPTTTEQILNPDRYFSGEEAMDVQPPEGIFGEDWAVVDRDTFGEFGLRVWLEAMGQPGRVKAAAKVAAGGWGGDAYALFEGPDGGSALAGVIAWDDPEQDSGEFAEGLSNVLDASSQFKRRSEGIPGAMVLWDGPGGVLGLARVIHPDHGGAIVFAVAPDAQQVITGLSAMSGI